MVLKNFFHPLSITLLSSASLISTNSMATTLTEAITSGKAYGDFRLRYEEVDASSNADSLTLRSRLGYKTADYEGFSAVIEVEDSRIVAGQGDFKVGPTGYNTGTNYAVIADPETTEVDQGYIQYKDKMLTIKAGRQVMTYDGHRFVGHVGWRQDRQTFDGIRLDVKASEKLTLSYSFINQRNRIFAEAADAESNDHLINISYNTSAGKLVGYYYGLQQVGATVDTSINTTGASFSGKTTGKTKFLYSIEVASQEKTPSNGSMDKFEADYLLLEAGAVFKGLTAKLGYESLGSDDGAYGFSTPLATLHKFNGWADQFLGTPTQGLTDTYVTLSTKVGGGKLIATYHDFAADESTATIDDFGNELDIQYTIKMGKNTSGGIKLAQYNAGDTATGKSDTDKIWLWTSLSF